MTSSSTVDTVWGAWWRTFGRAILDQLRIHARSPMAIFASLAMPCIFGFIVYSSARSAGAAGRLSADVAVGSSGIGMLDMIIAMIVLGLLGEKQWRTLAAALGTPTGLMPVVLGRLTGMAMQSLTALPGTFLVLLLLFGVGSGFGWLRWLVGGVLLALTTATVVGLLAFAVLRYPYSPGMTNGLVGLILALSALLVPQSALPAPVRVISAIVPQSHVMAWVRGAGASQLILALLLAAGYGVLVALAIRRLEHTARQRALSLEA